VIYGITLIKITTGTIEFRNHDGRIHRNNDLPAVVKYGTTITEHIWYKDGQIGRDNDQEAVQGFYKNGNICYKKWYINGKIHRLNDLPAVIVFHNSKTSPVKTKKWYNWDIVHRNGNLPAIIEIDKKGNIISEKWFINGKHSSEQPSIIKYNKDGSKKSEMLYDTNDRYERMICFNKC